MGESRGQPQRRRTIPRHRVVIAGGGVAALEAMLALDHLAGPRFAVTVVSPTDFFEYRPLAVTEPFDGAPPPRYELRGLLSTRGARHVKDAVAAVDSEAGAVELVSGGRLPYDFLLLAPGARATVGVPGATHFWSNTGAREVGRPRTTCSRTAHRSRTGSRVPSSNARFCARLRPASSCGVGSSVAIPGILTLASPDSISNRTGDSPR